MTTIYEAAGGMEVFVRLAEATHQRCLADPELHHPFSHADNQPDHTERLAAYWAEALGGPPTYTTEMGGSESHVQRLHAGEGDYTVTASPRFVRCVVESFDEAGVPDDRGCDGRSPTTSRGPRPDRSRRGDGRRTTSPTTLP